MKKIFVFAIVLLMICFSISGCVRPKESGCGKPKDPPEPSAVGFVLGAHRNFPALSASNEKSIYNKLIDVCTNYGDVSYAVVEGNPEQTDSISIKKPEKNLSKAKRKEIAKKNATGILNFFLSLHAKSPEVDTLKAISLSAKSLSSSDCDTKEMIIFDSGLCTSGLLSQLSSNILATDPNIVVQKLEEVHAIPELDDISIQWIGLGCVSAPQNSIPDSYLFSLRTLWQTIIERGGGSVYFNTMPVTGAEMEGLPDVSEVNFPSDNLGLDESSVIVFKEDTVKFIPDRAEFFDPSAAAVTLNPIGDFLKNNPDRKIIIAGTTAKVGDGDGIELSNARAQTVKQLLISSGIQESQMECLGLGCTENCFRVEDHNADGSLNEEMAAQNRAIYIVLSDSTTAIRLRQAQT